MANRKIVGAAAMAGALTVGGAIGMAMGAPGISGASKSTATTTTTVPAKGDGERHKGGPGHGHGPGMELGQGHRDLRRGPPQGPR